MQDAMESAKPEIEFWFDLASPYSYLSATRIDHLAERARVGVRWRPFLLGAIFKSFGWDNSPFVLQKEKGAYMWQDMARQCRKQNIPWTRPSTFPRHSVLAARVALCGADKPWIGAFCRGVMLRNFAHDQDIATEADVSEVLNALALSTATILAAAQSDENKSRLREQTDRAKSLGIFGAPTFFVQGEMYWGNDRLDDAIACARGSASG